MGVLHIKPPCESRTPHHHNIPPRLIACNRGKSRLIAVKNPISKAAPTPVPLLNPDFNTPTHPDRPSSTSFLQPRRSEPFAVINRSPPFASRCQLLILNQSLLQPR
jgi:hypothetical protein